MRYAFALLGFLFISGCIQPVLDDPVTSASGIAFISSHIPLPGEIITAEDIETSDSALEKPNPRGVCNGDAFLEKEL